MCAPARVRCSAQTKQLTAVNPAIAPVVRLNWSHGSQAVLTSLGATGAFTSESYANNHHLSIGSPLLVTTPTGSPHPAGAQGDLQAPRAAARRSAL